VVKEQRAQSTKQFYLVLVAIAVIGGLLIWRTAGKANSRVVATDVRATPAQAEGYLMGNPDAPVQIMEFADFECPACGQFATVTEPDVRKRIVETGLASYRFFDFPLTEIHKNTLAASNAAACASVQGKFWEMHDQLYEHQPQWSTEATSDPKKFFDRYASQIGLDVSTWSKCYDDQRHLQRIMSNRAEGERRNVRQTPTFIIGTKMIPGSLPYDMIKAYVDTAAAQVARSATTADSGAKGGN
jgi:protein-disulfide isomerase